MQELPPIPEQKPEPPMPGKPTETPNETPHTAPDIDIPSPSQPNTDPSPTPISPVG